MPQSGRIKKIKMESLGVFDINEVTKYLSENFDEDTVKEFKEKIEAKGKITEFFSKVIEKDLFNFVKFEKNINKEDYIQHHYKPPKISSSFLSTSLKCEQVFFFPLIN